MITTDILIIGAGPTGLFTVFEAGLLKLKCHLIDALPQPGGQCSEIYPKKPIYDIPAYPEILAGDLTAKLLEQCKQFEPGFTLGERADTIEKQEDGSFIVTTNKGTKHKAPVVAIASGLGSFEPRKPLINNITDFEEKGVDYMIKEPEVYRNKKVVIAGGGDSALDWCIFLSDIADQFNKYDYGKVTEFYVYNAKGINSTNQGIKIAKDAIASVTSGIVDQGRNITLSYLHKAIKYLNQLRMLEDSIVIYRLSRAPERRIFYIDVGNLPKIKAEQYLRDVMSRYRNKLVYDSNTGEVRDDKKHMSMLEDFWLPRREGGRGTEITTLPGGQNLGELTDIKYFQTQVYKALNVPPSRLESDKSFDLGKSEEINRDEIKFTKFVGRLRKKFSDLLHDLLKTQLILKGVIAPEDWEDMKEHIQYDYLYDNQFAELANLEMMEKKMEVLDKLDLYVGKYFSQDYVMRQLLHFTEQEIEEMKQQINNEIKAGQVIDPLDQVAQEKQTAEIDMETQKAQLDQLKNPPAPKPSGNSNTK